MGNLPYLTYSVPAESWDPDELGNHRAVIEVAADAETVGVRIPWRRRDPSPESKGILLFSEGGTGVANFLPLSVTNAYGDYLFEPADGPGRYFLYFMPYTGTVKKPYPQADYLPSDLDDSAWRRERAGRTLDEFPLAEVSSLESVDDFSRFTEMEITATDEELASLLASHENEGFLVFPESREFPIRMVGAVPYRWTLNGPGGTLAGRAFRGEYYVFQLGVYAHGRELSGVEVRFTDLITDSGAVGVPASGMTCFNTNGRGWDGEPFSVNVDVAAGRVQPLWCGIDIPSDVRPGEYAMEVSVWTGDEKKVCRIEVEIIAETIIRRGDDEPWRLSRLRWLDSTIGTEDEVVPPFIPVGREGMKLSILGREVVLEKTGLPGRILSRFSDDVSSAAAEPFDIIARPVEFKVGSADGGVHGLEAESFEIVEQGESFIRWTARSRAGGLRFEIFGELDFDGTVEYEAAVTAELDVEVSDISLETVFGGGAALFMTGLGRKGGYVPEEFEWKWDVRNNQDAVWIGRVNGGMQVTLKDDHYSRPLNTNFYLLKPLVMPVSWWNGGKGGVTMRRSGGEYVLSCTSGGRTVRKGETLRFDFRLFVSPFRPIDTEGHFTSRYFHAYRPIEEIVKTGANTINIHHATAVNPYINYPFLRSEILKEYIDGAHDRGCRVKLYYTVRELTTRAPELFALKSLGSEIVVDGAGGGHAWIQEHLAERYIAAWYALAVRDTSVINGTLSRWHNFYVEGMNWLAENLAIDGVYIDDLGFGREIMKRVRRVLHRHRARPLIDLHSANQYNVRDGFASSANLYLEHFPYIDRLWFGEYFDYDEKPDYWLVEVSGIPFGLMSEMLQDGGNPWRGMVFGMTGRLPRVEYNVPLWEMWDRYGLPKARMIGFWSASCPVATGNREVPATLYRGEEYSIIAIASWAEEETEVVLGIDLEKLGGDDGRMRLFIPGIDGFQAAAEIPDGKTVTVEPGKGKMIVIGHRG